MEHVVSYIVDHYIMCSVATFKLTEGNPDTDASGSVQLYSYCLSYTSYLQKYTLIKQSSFVCVAFPYNYNGLLLIFGIIITRNEIIMMVY